MDTGNEKIRHILKFSSMKATQTADNVNIVYGPDALKANVAQFWFRQLNYGNFVVKDAPRPW